MAHLLAHHRDDDLGIVHGGKEDEGAMVGAAGAMLRGTGLCTDDVVIGADRIIKIVRLVEAFKGRTLPGIDHAVHALQNGIFAEFFLDIQQRLL